jgi:hypothetical protein
VRPRHAMSYLRGPMTRLEITRARESSKPTDDPTLDEERTGT